MKNVHFNNERLNTVSNPPTPMPQTDENITDDTNKKAKKTYFEGSSIDHIANLKNSALKFVLSLFSKNNINRTNAFEIIDSIKQFILVEIVSAVKSTILPFIDINNQITLLDLLFNITNMFKNYDTEFKFRNALTSLNLLKSVDKVVFSRDIRPVHNRGDICLNESIKEGIVFPIDFYFEQFFKSHNLIAQSLKDIENMLGEKKLDNFVQGSIWRKKLNKFPKNEKIIPYFLYIDDLQINNSLGSHTSSVCAFYIAFPTIPNCYKIDNILIGALIKSSDLKEFGNFTCLNNLINKLITLEVYGINFVINDKTVNVKFVLGLVLGDNLALNTILECNKSFNANSYCRLCRITKTQAVHTCEEISEKMRDRKNYYLDIISGDSQKTGLKQETILNKIPSFHFTENYVVDIMHDLFEGVFIYDICKSILFLIEAGKCDKGNEYQKFSLTTLNLRKSKFNYGPIEVGNISGDITINRLKSNNLNMSARECWTFIHFFPLMFHDLIDNDSDVWKFICIVVRLLDIVLYVSHNTKTISLLRNTIKEHNKLYIEIFGDTLKPKHHFLTHYPTIIESSGPLRHFSNFMFEAKHKEIKTYANVTNNRICFVLSAAIKFQFKFAHKIFFNKSSCKQIIYNENQIVTSKFSDTISTYEHFKNVDFITLNSIFEVFEIKEIIFCISDQKVFLIYEKQFKLIFKPYIEGYFAEPFKNTLLLIAPINELIGFPFNITILHSGQKTVRLKRFTCT